MKTDFDSMTQYFSRKSKVLSKIWYDNLESLHASTYENDDEVVFEIAEALYLLGKRISDEFFALVQDIEKFEEPSLNQRYLQTVLECAEHSIKKEKDLISKAKTLMAKKKNPYRILQELIALDVEILEALRTLRRDIKAYIKCA
mgnify:CR=1 FL=1